MAELIGLTPELLVLTLFPATWQYYMIYIFSKSAYSNFTFVKTDRGVVCQSFECDTDSTLIFRLFHSPLAQP